MKSELAGIRNGVELYVSGPENEAEERQLNLREERCTNLLVELILKYLETRGNAIKPVVRSFVR